MKLAIPLITALALIVVVPSAHAALIGWTHSTYLNNGSEDGSSDLLPATGNWAYETGWNAGNGADVTVNGVTFLNNPDDNVGIDITRAGDTSTSGQNAGIFSGSFQTMMSTIAFGSNAANRSWSMTLEGLTVGETYRAQFFSHQSSGANLARQMEIHYGTDGTGPGTGVFLAGGVSDTVGDSWTALFNADASTQTFFFRPNTIGTDVPIINGVSVASYSPPPVPEPGSIALIFSGGLFVLCIARHRRKS